MGNVNISKHTGILPDGKFFNGFVLEFAKMEFVPSTEDFLNYLKEGSSNLPIAIRLSQEDFLDLIVDALEAWGRVVCPEKR